MSREENTRYWLLKTIAGIEPEKWPRVNPAVHYQELLQLMQKARIVGAYSFHDVTWNPISNLATVVFCGCDKDGAAVVVQVDAVERDELIVTIGECLLALWKERHD